MTFLPAAGKIPISRSSRTSKEHTLHDTSPCTSLKAIPVAKGTFYTVQTGPELGLLARSYQKRFKPQNLSDSMKAVGY